MCTMSNDPGCFSLENGAHTSSVSSSSDHAEVSDLEGDDVLDFVGGKVQLDAVVHLGIGVWVPDGAAVAGVQVRDTLGSSRDSPHPAKLVGSLRGSGPMDGEAS